MVSRVQMELRLLRAALWRRRGMVGLAVLAVAIGSSVAAALLHVSIDVSNKVGRELRVLGPNVLLIPSDERTPGGAHAGMRFMDETLARRRIRSAGADAALLLYAAGLADGRSIQLIGADLDAARELHPAWRLTGGESGSLLGSALAARLGVGPGDTLAVGVAGRTARTRVAVGAVLDAGGADDDAWWIPLETVQQLAGLEGRASLAQLRLGVGGDALDGALQHLTGDGLEALPLHALSETEAGLLARMRRLMLLVTIASVLAGGLAAFGTLTDLALVRRREIALMKSLGARRRDIVRQFFYESLVIGVAGGALGWMIGVVFATIIGREVFHSTIVLHPVVPLFVLALAIAVSVLAGFGPVRLALGVEPSAALKGE